ncbi:hypothetical protein B0H11DRAFT_1940021 [Mycena galericulata]|nr:hypothetical protein B0H11DRAFT_1940021 [Mycena galericulata]
MPTTRSQTAAATNPTPSPRGRRPTRSAEQPATSSSHTIPPAPSRAPSHAKSHPRTPWLTCSTTGLSPELRNLYEIARDLTPRSFNEAFLPFLQKYQEVVDLRHPHLLKVCPIPICWKDPQHLARNQKHYVNMNFNPMTTLKRWVDTDSGNGYRFSLAIMTTIVDHSVGKLPAEVNRDDWHMWLLLTAHAPEGKRGKTIITYDTDVEERHVGMREQLALGFEYSWVQRVQEKKGRSKDRVWQNYPVPNAQPGQYFCFHHTMQYLLEVAENGLDYTNTGTTLSQLKGFRQLPL